jgi:glycosyltransferase involved in cell wall biosynthesis
MPSVTIVMPVYNHRDYVEESLASLYKQTYRDFEIVAVDDGSTDRSLSILNRHRNRIRVIESNHSGPAAARNRALQATDSEFVAFMDADDLCSRDRLQLQIERLEKLDMVASALTFIDAGGEPLAGYWKCPPEASNDYWASLLERNWIGTPSVTIRRNVLNTSGLFDESFTHAEDYDLWLRIGRQHSIGFIDSPQVQCRRHASNTSIDIGSHQSFERMALQKIDHQEAWEAFQRLYPAKQDEQRRAESWIWFLLRRGDFAFPEEALRARAKHPQSASIQFAIGVYQYDSGAYEDALASFDLLKELDVSARHNLGVIYVSLGNRTAAAAHLRAALDLRPDYYDAQHNLKALTHGHEIRLTRRPLRQAPVPMRPQVP